MSGKDNARRVVTVKRLLSGRYSEGDRPMFWEQRKPGIDLIVTDDDEQLALYSDGGQSTPAAGWRLLLIEESSTHTVSGDSSYSWTLYGISKLHQSSLFDS